MPSGKEKAFAEMVEEDKANMARRLVVVQNFCYTCPFCEPMDPPRKAKSGNPVMKCAHPVFVYTDEDPPVLGEDSAFIPLNCPLHDGAWTVELHPHEREMRRIQMNVEEAIAVLGRHSLNSKAVARCVQAFHEGYHDILPGQRRNDDVIAYYEAGCRARDYDGKKTD